MVHETAFGLRIKGIDSLIGAHNAQSSGNSANREGVLIQLHDAIKVDRQYPYAV